MYGAWREGSVLLRGNFVGFTGTSLQVYNTSIVGDQEV